MKAIVAIALLFGLNAQANTCPDLDGEWTCKSGGVEEIYTFNQQETNGTTTYQFDSDFNIIADGNSHTIKDEEETTDTLAAVVDVLLTERFRHEKV